MVGNIPHKAILKILLMGIITVLLALYENIALGCKSSGYHPTSVFEYFAVVLFTVKHETRMLFPGIPQNFSTGHAQVRKK